MPDDWPWTPDETGMDDADAPLDPLVAREFGLWDVYDAEPCPWCGEPACERSCTAAILADTGTGEAAHGHDSPGPAWPCPRCQGTAWVEEGIGWRCRRCLHFLPSGCEPADADAGEEAP